MMQRHKWIPTGFSASATGGGLSGTLVASDALICQKVVGFIDDKRFMVSHPRDEISDHVRSSVQEVRAYSVNAQYLPGSKTSQAAIKEIARACRTYIDTAKPGVDQEVLNVALMALRKRIGTQLLALVEKYNLDCDLDLGEYRDDALDILQDWIRAEPYALQ